MSTLFEMIDRLKSWLELRHKYRGERNQAFDDALLAIHRAANRTRAYIADVRVDPNARHRAQEGELSDLWVQVGDKLRRLHEPEAEALYQRCFLKAEYWANPDAWEDGDVAEAGIGLDYVVREVDSYIHVGPPTRRRRRAL